MSSPWRTRNVTLSEFENFAKFGRRDRGCEEGTFGSEWQLRVLPLASFRCRRITALHSDFTRVRVGVLGVMTNIRFSGPYQSDDHRNGDRFENREMVLMKRTHSPILLSFHQLSTSDPVPEFHHSGPDL